MRALEVSSSKAPFFVLFAKSVYKGMEFFDRSENSTYRIVKFVLCKDNILLKKRNSSMNEWNPLKTSLFIA